MINKILFITLSNIGDAILTLPAMDFIKQNFPESKITVMVGPRPQELFQNTPCVDTLVVYDKHSPLKEKIKLFLQLNRERFDLVIDLRNTFLGAALSCRYRTSPFLRIPSKIRHMKERHLFRTKSAIKKITQNTTQRTENRVPFDFAQGKQSTESLCLPKNSLCIKEEDQEYIKNLLHEYDIRDDDTIIVIAPGARSNIKRWPQEKFSKLIPEVTREFRAKVILVGDKNDAPIARLISEDCKAPVIDLSGKTNISQLARVLQRAKLLITNDSAVLHLGSYLNVPVAAIFGPTDERKYSPWSGVSAVVKKEIFCRPCEKAKCRFGTLGCMHFIKTEDVLREIRKILPTTYNLPVLSAVEGQPTTYEYKRILVVRTDRIGDVLLSTPVLKALRDTYPYAYIAMMVSPYCKEVVEGNPYLDEAIIYDKAGKHRTWLSSLKFALKIRKKKFDLALILHPTNRVHLVTFFASIPKRVGYDRKLGILLTDRIKHTKQFGEKHEVDYNLELLKKLGIEPAGTQLYMPIREESEAWVEILFRKEGIKETDKLLAIHPGASCPSKLWPDERFAQVSDRLAQGFGFKVLVIAGPKDMGVAKRVIAQMRHPALDLAGKTSVSQLASLLKKCRLFISNDSGPVHIASAVKTPVISIFGRNQKGLSPMRWGPTGKKDRIIHKEVGCIRCLAHNCKKEFACLKAITVEDVLEAAEAILKEL